MKIKSDLILEVDKIVAVVKWRNRSYQRTLIRTKKAAGLFFECGTQGLRKTLIVLTTGQMISTDLSFNKVVARWKAAQAMATPRTQFVE
jgi:hypothetical protein